MDTLSLWKINSPESGGRTSRNRAEKGEAVSGPVAQMPQGTMRCPASRSSRWKHVWNCLDFLRSRQEMIRKAVFCPVWFAVSSPRWWNLLAVLGCQKDSCAQLNPADPMLRSMFEGPEADRQLSTEKSWTIQFNVSREGSEVWVKDPQWSYTGFSQQSWMACSNTCNKWTTNWWRDSVYDGNAPPESWING